MCLFFTFFAFFFCSVVGGWSSEIFSSENLRGDKWFRWTLDWCWVERQNRIFSFSSSLLSFWPSRYSLISSFFFLMKRNIIMDRVRRRLYCTTSGRCSFSLLSLNWRCTLCLPSVPFALKPTVRRPVLLWLILASAHMGNPRWWCIAPSTELMPAFH